MKKSNFKNLALLGVTGVVLTSSPVQAEETVDNQQMIAVGGCGGRSGCGNKTRSQSSCAGRMQPQSGCGNKTAPNSGDRSYYNTADAYSDQSTQSTYGDTSSQYGGSSSQQGRQQQWGSSRSNSQDSDFLSQLNEEGKAVYRGLDAEGKALAQQLATSGQYTDKNQAVDAAARRMAEKRASMNRSGSMAR